MFNLLRCSRTAPFTLADGRYSGFDLSEGGKLYRESSNCSFPSTFASGARGYLFVTNAKANVAGYARSFCVGEVEDPAGDE